MPRDLRDVVVSDPKIVDAVVQTSNRAFLLARRVGDANVFFFDTTGQLILTLEIKIGYNSTSLEEVLNRLIPGAKITVETIGKSVVLKGRVPTPLDSNRASRIASEFIKGQTETVTTFDETVKDKSENGGTTLIVSSAQKEGQDGGTDAQPSVINMLTVEGREQVMLKVTVAEMQRDALKRLGVNLSALARDGNFSIAKVIQNTFPVTNSDVAEAAVGAAGLAVPGLNAAQSVLNAPGVTAGSALQGTWQTPNNRVSTLIQALERIGLVRTLAEPNLTAISGEVAIFRAGGEFPIPVATQDGQITVDWKQFGVGLSFTPLVISENRISLRIESEVSDLTSKGAVTIGTLVIPALQLRRAKTTVELPSGGSLVIAGLLSDDTRQSIEGVPGLKNLPVLGTLFRSRDFRRKESELVVIVTPYMVKPVSRAKLARPDGGFAPASDLKADLLGHLNRVYGRAVRLPTGRYEGDYGFIVE